MALCMFAKEGSEIVVVHTLPSLSVDQRHLVDANETPELGSARADRMRAGTAYRIRTGDLRLERAVS